jgi:rubrerythrin
MDRRKEVMIVTCKHLVFCRQCDYHYNLKNPTHKECPICRKEYKKTLTVLYT